MSTGNRGVPRPRPRTSLLDRYLASTDRPADPPAGPLPCYRWTGRGRDRYGNPRMKDPATGGWVFASHFALAHFGGVTVVKGRKVEHLCRDRNCVRAEHLRQEGPADRGTGAQPQLLELAGTGAAV